MSIQAAVVKTASDLRITSVVAIHTMSFLAAHADEQGYAATDENGHSLADPRFIAAQTGYGVSSVYKALGQLEKYGHITWDKAFGADAVARLSGRIKINVPSDAPRA